MDPCTRNTDKSSFFGYKSYHYDLFALDITALEVVGLFSEKIPIK